jgi:hypothetical protein
MVKTHVQAGVCGFATDITAISDDMQNVTLGVTSTCEKIAALGSKLPVLDAYSEIGTGYEGELYKVIRENIQGCCAGCAVQVGLFKAMQVAAGLALPRDIEITITKE